MNKLQLFFRKYVLPYLMVMSGAAVAAFALAEFLVPSTILDGGITGVSMILNYLTKKPLSVFIIVINIPFLLVGMFALGRAFLLRAASAMVVFSVLLSIFEHSESVVTYDPLLATVFGGILLGVGVGTVLRNGGCLHGTETVALLLSRKTSFSVGQIVFAINIVIYSCAGVLFGWDRAMYSLLTYFITFKVIDMVEEGMEQAKAVFIITDPDTEIAEKIYQRLGRTCTQIDASGLISGSKVVLYCVVTRLELSELRAILRTDAHSSFATVTEVGEIVGTHMKRNTPRPETLQEQTVELS